MTVAPPFSIRALVAAAALGLAPLPGWAQDVVPGTPTDVMNAFAATGFLARLDEDAEGDPLIRATMNGKSVQVYFYGCDGDTGVCNSVSFYTWFSTEPAPSLELMNAWNKGRRFGRAHIDDDGDAVIEMDVNLFGGVTDRNLADWVDWWRVVLLDFQSHLDGV